MVAHTVDRATRLPQRTAEMMAGMMARPLAPGLHLVATPIGNLADITLRALAVLAAADVVYCEDTRHSRILFDHFGISSALKPYHEHNGAVARPEILARLAAGARIALVSDAGTPLISDPGYKLVRAALEAGHAVTAIPGASAILTGLVASGLPTDCFLFAGFMPAKQAARRTRLAALKPTAATLVLFEAPTRLAALLGDIAATLGPREIAVARELTKLHETIVRGPADRLALQFEMAAPRGEVVVLIAPPQEAPPDDTAVRDQVRRALATMSVRDAADAVATALGVPRGRVYAQALEEKEAMHGRQDQAPDGACDEP